MNVKVNKVPASVSLTLQLPDPDINRQLQYMQNAPINSRSLYLSLEDARALYKQLGEAIAEAEK